MVVGSKNNPKFIRYCMKFMMDALDPREELFGLINFDGAKVVQVEGELLEVDRPNLTCMLCSFRSGNTYFSNIVKLEFLNNLIWGSNLVHQVFGGKFHHCYDFFQKTVREFKHVNYYKLTTMTEARCYYWTIIFNRELFLV